MSEKGFEGISIPIPEQKEEIPKGSYKIKATFILRKGGEYTLTESLNHYQGYTPKEFKNKVLGNLANMGLHNFGLDSREPVKITVTHESGKEEMVFNQKFDHNGYVSDN